MSDLSKLVSDTLLDMEEFLHSFKEVTATSEGKWKGMEYSAVLTITLNKCSREESDD